MRTRSALAALAVLSVFGLSPGAEASKPPKKVVQKFQAMAYPGLLACSMETGQYRTATHKFFTAPARGTFNVIIGNYAGPTGKGDWDLYVLDPDGNMIDYDFTTYFTAEVKIKVVKKQRLDIMMCNFDDLGTTADGIITFTYA